MKQPNDIATPKVSSIAKKKTISVSFNLKTIFIILIVIILMVLAFWAGYLFSSHQNHASDSNTSSRASTLFLRRRYGFLGTVSAVSTTSITATSSRTGTSKTFNIISSTVITENHQTISVSKIANGDTVIITSSKTQPNNAIRIIVNPAYDSFRQPVNGSSTTNGSASQ